MRDDGGVFIFHLSFSSFHLFFFQVTHNRQSDNFAQVTSLKNNRRKGEEKKALVSLFSHLLHKKNVSVVAEKQRERERERERGRQRTWHSWRRSA